MHRQAENCYRRDSVEMEQKWQKRSSHSSRQCLHVTPIPRFTGSQQPHTGHNAPHAHTGNLSRKSSWLNRNPMSVKVRWKNPVGRRTITKCRFPGNDACRKTEITFNWGCRSSNCSQTPWKDEYALNLRIFFWLPPRAFSEFHHRLDYALPNAGVTCHLLMLAQLKSLPAGLRSHH